MVRKQCPMLKKICIESDCEWFIDDAGVCAVVSLSHNLWMVTYPQIGGGALKVVDG